MFAVACIRLRVFQDDVKPESVDLQAAAPASSVGCCWLLLAVVGCCCCCCCCGCGSCDCCDCCGGGGGGGGGGVLTTNCKQRRQRGQHVTSRIPDIPPMTSFMRKYPRKNFPVVSHSI